MNVDLPIPPPELAARVGPFEGEEGYLALGAAMRADIEDLLGSEWLWDGKRVLDFGAGAGRLLRHFAAEAAQGSIVRGCDVDAESIAWLNAHLRPPLAESFTNHDDPPLDVPDGEFDLIVAASVFTHLAGNWAAWLLEMRRVLAPGGCLIASFLGSGMSEAIAAEEWDPDRIGMNVIGSAQSWVQTNVLNSPWWLRAHWGRAFEIVEVRDSGFAMAPGEGHGLVLARKPESPAPSAEELIAPEPGEQRELAAAAHNAEQLRRLLAGIPGSGAAVAGGVSAPPLPAELLALRSEVTRLSAELDRLRGPN